MTAKKMTKARMKEWIRWSMDHLDSKRVDAFFQGWRCASGFIMAFDGVPQEVRKEMAAAMAEAESTLWGKTKKRRC